MIKQNNYTLGPFPVKLGDEKQNIDPDLLATMFITIFSTAYSHQTRQGLLFRILKQCDPFDMRYIGEILPTLHRDFLRCEFLIFRLLPRKISFLILSYVSPRDISVCTMVSKKWAKLTHAKDLWYFLYTCIGLNSMASVFHLPNSSALQNARRFESLGNWARGIFKYRSFQAHELSILSSYFDGR